MTEKTEESVRDYAPPGELPERAYMDLHEQVQALDEAGLLIRVDVPINKDTELHPLMRWQFSRRHRRKGSRSAMLFTERRRQQGQEALRTSPS